MSPILLQNIESVSFLTEVVFSNVCQERQSKSTQ